MVPENANRSPRSRRFLRAIGYTTAFLVLTTTIAAVVVLANFERLTPYMASAFSRSTGRELRVDGLVDARFLSWRPSLVVEKISYANPDWSKEEQMLEIGRLQVGIALRRLLRGNLAFTKLRLDDATVRLEERADGSNNWTLWVAEAVEPDEPANLPAIRHLRLNKSRLLYTRENAPQAATDLQFDRANGTVAKVVRIRGEGRYQKNPAKLVVEAGSIAELHDEETPFPIDLQLQAGATSASIVGHLAGGLASGGLDVKLRLKGDSMSGLYPLIGVVLPPSPPYELTGKLEHQGDLWKFAGFTGRMGDSDLSGNVTVDLGPARPKMTAEFRSKLLDFDDLGGLVGAPPATGAGETASADQKKQAATQQAEGRVLPDTPVDVPRLHAMDIDARLVATRVNAPQHLPIDDLDLRFQLENGTLRATPAVFDVASGRVELYATLYSDRQPLRADVEMRVRGLDAARILGPTPFTEETGGRLNGDAKLAMTGGSLREMAATADGTMRLALADARVSKLLIELIGLDIMNSIGVVLKGDEPATIRCAAFDLKSEDGQVQSELAVIDTEKATLEADLSLNLGTEMLSARIVPHPKDVSLLSLRQDLLVEGRLADLDFYPDPLKLGPVKGFMQKIDYLLAPIVGLITPFDVDTKEKHDDSGCSAFLREQQERRPLAGLSKPERRTGRN